MVDKSRKQQLEEMLQEDPADSFLRYAVAMEYVSEGNDREALTHFATLLQADSSYIAGYHQSGLALVRLGQLDRAREILRHGIALAQQQGNLHSAEEMEGLLASIS
jgi:Tfp pilus assembly protein PilF